MKNKIITILVSMVLFTMICPITINAKEKYSNKEYQSYDITTKDNIYYYKGKRIRIFFDIRSDQSFVKSFVDNKGKVDIRILRDDNDKITKVKRISKKKADKILKDIR